MPTQFAFNQTNGNVVSVTDYGAVPGSLDDQASIFQAAIDSLPALGGVIWIEPGLYMIGTRLRISSPGVVIKGLGSGSTPFANPRLKAVSGSGINAIIDAIDGAHGVQFENIHFDGNNTAQDTLAIETTQGSSLQMASVKNCSFVDYTRYGLRLGQHDAADTTKNGQLRHVILEQLWFKGSDTSGTIGLYANTQNMEQGICNGLYFDPDVGDDHLYHIKAVSGHLTITGMTTTRATSYAIWAKEPPTVRDWASEDSYLLESRAVGNQKPWSWENVYHRGAHAGIASTTETVILDSVETPVRLSNCEIMGSISVGPTSERWVSAKDIFFLDATDDGLPGSFIFDPTSDCNGTFDSQDTVSIHKRDADGVFLELRDNTNALFTSFGKIAAFNPQNLPTGATPSINGGVLFYTNNGGATTITSFTNTAAGQVIILLGNDGGNTTVSDNASIKLAGSGNLTLANGDTLTLVRGPSSVFSEIARSVV